MTPTLTDCSFATDDQRWRAILERDRCADGHFVYAVKTMGVYCRPSCPGRPKRINVSFHANADEARVRGFRACKRCRPDSLSIGTRPESTLVAGRKLEDAIRFAFGKLPLGNFLVAASKNGVCAILMGDSEGDALRELERCFPDARLVEDREGLKRLVDEALLLARAPAGATSFPLDIRGTEFQKRVWQTLRQIPAGSTLTYSGLAELIGRPTAARAVARACASNRIAIAIPCHRIVGAGGGLGGYRWGIERKRALLNLEGALP